LHVQPYHNHAECEFGNHSTLYQYHGPDGAPGAT